MFWQNVGRRSVWRDMARLQREMNRLFDDSMDIGGRGEFPPLNVWAGAEDVMVTAEIPGVDSEDLDISVVGDTLTLSGSRSAEDSDERRYHRRERWQGSFSRTIQLPFRIDVEAVDAEFRNGVLQVMLPRAEEDKPQRITISAG